MKKIYTIGIDIGGTNTDAVLVDAAKRIVAHCKVTTTVPMEVGFSRAIDSILAHPGIEALDIGAIYVGTTHATNAILQCQDLYKVGVIRLAGHKPATLPPCFGWPETLKEAVLCGVACIEGGFECDGRPLTALEPEGIRRAASQLIDKDCQSIAVSGVFSPLYSGQELAAREIIHDFLSIHVPVSLSHQIGGIGFIERENATILNAALKKVITEGFSRLKEVCYGKGLHCPLHVTQNNGSVMSIEHASEYPVLTISAGPTNSFIGGGKLAGLNDAIIVDIGGTSTDLGIVQNGFPRRCLHRSNIGGVDLNFAMPDVLSIALGGGSLVALEGDEVRIGPESCARKLVQQALSFGGNKLTLTDIAVRLGHVEIYQASKERIAIDPLAALRVMDKALEHILHSVSKIEMKHQDLPVVLVGGGASLLSRDCLPERFQIPPYAHVANAYGAALAEISTTIDTIASLTQRNAVLQELKEKALRDTIAKGACPRSSRIIEMQVIPYHYMPGNKARVVVTAAGKVKQ